MDGLLPLRKKTPQGVHVRFSWWWIWSLDCVRILPPRRSKAQRCWAGSHFSSFALLFFNVIRLSTKGDHGKSNSFCFRGLVWTFELEPGCDKVSVLLNLGCPFLAFPDASGVGGAPSSGGLGWCFAARFLLCLPKKTRGLWNTGKQDLKILGTFCSRSLGIQEVPVCY